MRGIVVTAPLTSLNIAVNRRYGCNDLLMAARAYKHARFYSRTARDLRRQRAKEAALKAENLARAKRGQFANYRRCVEAACQKGAVAAGYPTLDTKARDLFWRLRKQYPVGWIPVGAVAEHLDRSQHFLTTPLALRRASERLLRVLLEAGVILRRWGKIMPLTLEGILAGRKTQMYHGKQVSFEVEGVSRKHRATNRQLGPKEYIHPESAAKARASNGRFVAAPLKVLGEGANIATGKAVRGPSVTLAEYGDPDRGLTESHSCQSQATEADRPSTLEQQSCHSPRYTEFRQSEQNRLRLCRSPNPRETQCDPFPGQPP